MLIFKLKTKSLIIRKIRSDFITATALTYNNDSTNEIPENSSLTKENPKSTIKPQEPSLDRKDDHIPKDELSFFKTENGKTVAFSKVTGETSGLGPEIDKENS